ncbi:MAG: hypothetical protein WAQ53_16540 [Thiofilum sp.]|uniref:hypothetical protein n=1 Tax=Thiofilum sp. TaxID=2212733 RepID=UPI0025E6946C|nr:hypothetical protein [Thiofilum sp.]MBK8452457.1 hypothetical protein [Thiofilum sp.]
MMKQWVVLISLGLLVACSEPPEAIVKELAQQRWSALLQGNTSQAYALYTKAFQDTTPLQQFENSIRGLGLWKAAQVVDTQCKDSQCQVNVKVTVAMKMRGLPEPIETSEVIQETWIKDTAWKSEWRYVKN